MGEDTHVMSYWSLLTEFIALLLVLILLLSLAIYKKGITRSLKMFGACLILSGCSIILNMSCVILLRQGRLVPAGINLLFNSLYFWFVVLLCSVTALYIFEKMLEHVYDQYCIVRARRMLTALVCLYTVLIFLNLVAGKQKFQILLIVPRDFGVINQRYRHQTGNEYLYAMASWLEEAYRNATVFRYIGVTFAVIFPYKDAACADRYIREVEQRFEQPWAIGECEEMISAVFSSMIHDGGDKEENKMMEQLFEVWYQPVYCPDKGCCHSAEALVRLRDGAGGFLSPDEFIPVAEGIGIVSNIFWQVLGEVCRFIKQNPDLPIGTFSVNMSMEQFEEPDLPIRIQRLLEAWEIRPDTIKFEITERVISEDAEHAKKMIHQLEEYGFHFYLDDFGIGYSNFASVAEYRFESIKLDKSLVSFMEKADKGYDIVHGLIRLFHEMGMKVTVEGVETAEQSSMLIGMGVDKIQGFYYAHPMPGAELKRFRG